VGIVAIFHAAYSCLHYRNILNDLDLDEQMMAGGGGGGGSESPNTLMIPPVDVIVEVALGFGCLLLGELVSMGSLQSVVIGGTSAAAAAAHNNKHKPLIAPAYRTRDFDHYENRSQFFSTVKKSK